MKLINSILTKNPCYTAGRKITPRGLMLHSVGCPQPNASVFINNWNRASYNNACVHAFIDALTGAVYQTLPWNHRGWHGGGSSNNTHIGVEMCEPACIKYTGGSTFTCSDLATAKACVKRTYESAVELFAYLCKLYGLNPLKDICSHKEGCKKGIASNHGDPEHLWNGLKMGYTMDGFRKDVHKAMYGNITVTTSNATKNYLVKGDTGAEVKTMQTMLIAVGVSCGSCGADGSFGNDTDKAVRKYQESRGLEVDGSYGPLTKAKLTAEYNALKTTAKKGYSGAFPTMPPRGYYLKGDGYKTLTSYKAQIKRIQSLLNWIMGANIAIDGQYGPDTEALCEKYQRKYGLKVDGSFGKESLAKAKTIKK